MLNFFKRKLVRLGSLTQQISNQELKELKTFAVIKQRG
jgi:hypothetical protein